MTTKRKPAVSRKPKARGEKPKARNGQAPPPAILAPLPWEQLVKLYPSLAQGPTPEQRRCKFLAAAAARGIQVMSPKEFDRWLEHGRAVWPDDDEIDDFVAWVRRCRQQGWYD